MRGSFAMLEYATYGVRRNWELTITAGDYKIANNAWDNRDMSASDRKLVNSYVQQLLVEAEKNHVPDDVIGRLLVSAAIGIWRKSRSIDDIAAELEFTIENLDPDAEYPFMRP